MVNSFNIPIRFIRFFTFGETICIAKTHHIRPQQTHTIFPLCFYLSLTLSLSLSLFVSAVCSPTIRLWPKRRLGDLAPPPPNPQPHETQIVLIRKLWYKRVCTWKHIISPRKFRPLSCFARTIRWQWLWMRRRAADRRALGAYECVHIRKCECVYECVRLNPGVNERTRRRQRRWRWWRDGDDADAQITFWAAVIVLEGGGGTVYPANRRIVIVKETGRRERKKKKIDGVACG